MHVMAIATALAIAAGAAGAPGAAGAAGSSGAASPAQVLDSGASSPATWLQARLPLRAPAASSARKTVLAPGDRLHIQLSGRLVVPRSADAVELDGAETTARRVRKLKRRGFSTICYVSAGSWENYRKDARRFPRRLLGKTLDGWPNERWLDIRRHRRLRPLINRRIRQCARKGFEGIEFDNVEGYTNRTGFPITRRQQLRYNRMLARLAKKHGLSPGLKNSIGLVRPLSRNFDWALNEECVTYRECGAYRHFTKRGKGVVIIEYGDTRRRLVCRTARRIGATAQLKRLRLSSWARHC